MSWISVLRLSFAIRINVSSAETVYVPARKFRESVHLDLHSVEQKQWLCCINKKIAETQCVNCGQCRAFCPTGAISIHTNTDKVFKALADPDIRVVAQIAPAVRVAVGDHYGLQKGRSVMGKIVNALHRMGFDEVYDTTFQC